MDENNQQDIKEAQVEETPEKGQVRQIKNLIALAILLGGLSIGSLFVDIIQMVAGQGFSSRKIQEAGVLESNGKTWVAYDQPIIGVKVFSNSNCADCKTDEVLVWLRRVMPTIKPEKIDVETEEGKELAAKFEIKTIPGFVFSPEVAQTDFFEKTQNVFSKKNDNYVLNGVEIGIPVGQYLETPAVAEQNAKVGRDDAPVKLVEFSDFQCPYCKVLHESIKQILSETGNDVQLIFKNLPLDIHSQAGNAALAAACASEQGKFEDYANKLFASQGDWGKSAGTFRFKAYAAQMRLNVSQFNKCLDDKKYQDLINQDKDEATKFGITGTPAIFINGQFKNGAVSLEELKTIIDGELGK